MCPAEKSLITGEHATVRCALCREPAVLCTGVPAPITLAAIVQQHSNRALLEALALLATLNVQQSQPSEAASDQVTAWLAGLATCERGLKPLYAEVSPIDHASACMEHGQHSPFTAEPREKEPAPEPRLICRPKSAVCVCRQVLVLYDWTDIICIWTDIHNLNAKRDGTLGQRDGTPSVMVYVCT